MDPKMFAVHDAQSDYPNLNGVHGVEYYCDRALLTRANTVVTRGGFCHMDQYLQDLRDVGIGPSRVLTVEPHGGESLYNAILTNGVKGEMQRHVREGGTVGIFRPCEASEAFLYGLGLNWSNTTAPPLDIANRLNCKVHLREIGDTSLFAPYKVVRNEADLIRAIRDLCRDGACGYRYTYETDQAHSAGMDFLPIGSRVRYVSTEMPQLVDRLFPSIPFSIVVDITNDGPVLRFGSGMEMENEPMDTIITVETLARRKPIHKGNYMGPSGSPLGKLPVELFESFFDQCRPLLYKLGPMGCRGQICLDAIWLPDGRMFLTEINARMSHSGYVREIFLGLEKRFGRQFFVTACNASCHKSVGDYPGAMARLQSLNTQPECEGVRLYHPRLIPHKAGLIVWAGSMERMKALRDAAQLRLNAAS